MPNKIFYTYDQMIQGVNSISRQMVLDQWKPDCVVGVLRGGVIPAVHLSHWWKTKMLAFPWTTRDGMTDETKNAKPIADLILSGQNVLLVDDICDSALTFRQITDAVMETVGSVNWNSNQYRTAALHYNIGQSVFDPDYYHVEINKEQDPSWIVYPWEA